MLNLLYDCLYLGEPDLKKPANSLKDTLIEGILIREYESMVNIYFLWTSDYIQIPREYFIIFRNFEVYCGERVSEKTIPKNRVEQFLIESILLIRNQSLLQDITINLNKILKIKTDSFRDWLNKKLNIKLDPWLYVNLAGQSEI